MAQVDPRTPVIIGVAQMTVQRGQQPGPEPLAGWEDVARAALRDAGVDEAKAAEADAVLLSDCMSWRYDDPTRRLAERLGASPSITYVGSPSGTSGQVLVNKAADEIRKGNAELVVISGGEALATMKWYRQRGEFPSWSHVHPDGPAFPFDLDDQQHPGEVAVGLTEGVGAVYTFAMREVARRAHLGIAPDAYRRQLGELAAGLTRVAAKNPTAWFGTERDPDFLITPRDDNRFISYPYTKHMVSIIDVDMFAAIIVASEGWADANNVPRERRVYPWTSCYTNDPVYTAPRENLWKADGMHAASKATLDAAGVSMDEVKHVDIYSCFPAAVNFARDALGISDRPGDRVTESGGLPYGGGPAASYMLISIGKMASALRNDPGTFGMTTGVGMMMSNHVFALYSTNPPPAGLKQPDQKAVQASVDAIPQRTVVDNCEGPGSIVTYTVMYGRNGERTHGAAIVDLPDGNRAYVRIRDAAILEAGETSELVGRKVDIKAGADVGEIVACEGVAA